MCPRGNDNLRGGCKKIELSEDQKNVDLSCSRNTEKRSSQPSTISSMTKSSLGNFVYKRRKLSSNYNSRTLGNGQENSYTSGNCLSSASCNTCVVSPKEKHDALMSKHEGGAIRLRPSSSVSKSKPPKGSISSEGLVDKTPEGCVLRIIEANNVNDSCSSSMSFIDQVQSSIKVELDEPSECSSSSVATVKFTREDLLEKEFCINILRNHGLLSSYCSTTSIDSTEDTTDNDGTCFRSCKICCRLETTSKLLICDNCEEAFHMYCCKPKIKKVPADEWFCHSCVEKGCAMSKKKVARKFPSKSLLFKGRTNTIGLMLRKTEPYTTSVRIGKAFQAEVPDWFGLIKNDDGVGEPTNMDISEYLTFHEFNPCKTSESGMLNNWLQCQAVLDASENDLTNETICGKWRRAPLFEVQTNDWECFCSVQWDPHFADCAVPQEVATDEVRWQLKRMEKLRPQLLAKWKNRRDTKSNDNLGNPSTYML